jgi:glycosyltransferase involved in cell wall biosynthesis
VIDAVALLKDRGLNVFVSFAGKDYDDGVRQLKEYAKGKGVEDRVTFAGFLTRVELETYLANSDIYVMPTKAEGLPRVIIEAMAKGLPCLTTDVSGNSELIDKEMMFDFYDVKTIADLVEMLIKNPHLYEITSRKNFLRSQKYEASILEKRRDDFYTKLKSTVLQNM